jgi:uncharacterized integral membrane protein
MRTVTDNRLADSAKLHQEFLSMKSLHTFITVLVVIMVMLAGFLFTLNNTLPVSVWLGIELPPVALGIWVLGAFITGGFIGLLLGAGLLRRLIAKIRAQKAQARLMQQEKEIDNLKQQVRLLQHRK